MKRTSSLIVFLSFFLTLASSQTQSFDLSKWKTYSHIDKLTYVSGVIESWSIYEGFLNSKGDYSAGQYFALIRTTSDVANEAIFYMDDFFLHILPSGMESIPNIQSEAWRYVFSKLYEKVINSQS